jgi:chemotaxis methyl-accepting protein methylase
MLAMKVSAVLPCKNLYFGSNSGAYRTQDGNLFGTYTNMFRPDLNWERFSDFVVKHFKNKDNVEVVQFGSSDGSEAYTLIMSLMQKNKDVDKFFPIEAYDINKDIYNVAQSGFININKVDKLKLAYRKLDFKKYFEETNVKISIPNDTPAEYNGENGNTAKTYKVSKTLKDRVNFHNKDMFEVLRNMDKSSDTVVLCRNVLDYLSNREIDEFTTTAACHLKKGSLFVIGEIDEGKVANSLESKGFIKVMQNVYMLA